MKKLILIFLINCGLYAKTDLESKKQWETSLSYGFLSEKTPISMLEISKLLNYNNNEFYATMGTMLFGSGLGLGYKYYLTDKYKSSIFINFGYHLSYLGTADDGFSIYGFNLSPGYCILQKNEEYTYTENILGGLKQKKYKKSSINIGLSFIYFGDKSSGVIPFISWQKIL